MDEKITSILVPSGIGDIFWIMAKMESFLKEQNISNPEIFIQQGNGADGIMKQRALPFVEKFSFVKAGGYLITGNQFQAFKDGYLHDKANLFYDIAGCDLFLTFNGSLRMGRELADVSPQWETNWYPEMIRSDYQIQKGKEYSSNYGSYVVAYFVPHGMYQGWLVQFQKEKIYESMKSIVQETGKKIILIGATWDDTALKDFFLQKAKQDNLQDSFINLVGETSLDDILALVENCSLMYGFPSGVSFLAPYYKKQTLILWNDYFCEDFHWNCVVPESRTNWYHALQTYKHDLRVVTKKLLECCNA